MAADSQLPSAPHAEEAALKILLTDRTALAIAVEKFGLIPADFNVPEFLEIARIVIGDFRAGHFHDAVSVIEALRKSGHLAAAGGPERIEALAQSTGELENIENYLALIAEAAIKRMAADGLDLLRQSALNGSRPSEITQKMAELTDKISKRTAQSAGEASDKIRVYTLEELEVFPEPKWLVEGVIQERTVGTIEGPPGAYKSYMAVELAGCVATGHAWYGNNVTPGPVLYISAEGKGGLVSRIHAWQVARGMKWPPSAGIIPDAVQLLESEDVGLLLSIIAKMNPSPVLVIVDTLARCMVGGDENSAQDMGIFVHNIARIAAAGAAVIVVHHQGKGGDLRGSSSLPGGMDTRITVARDDISLTIHCQKLKGALEFNDFGLTRRLVDLPGGRTNMVLDRADQTVIEVEVTETQNNVLSILQNFPGPVKSKEWEEACKAASVSRASFWRAKKQLVAADVVVESAGRYFPKDGTEPSQTSFPV